MTSSGRSCSGPIRSKRRRSCQVPEGGRRRTGRGQEGAAGSGSTLATRQDVAGGAEHEGETHQGAARVSLPKSQSFVPVAVVVVVNVFKGATETDCFQNRSPFL